MIIIVLLGALVIYTCIYLTWQGAEGNLGSVAALLTVVEQMIFRPEHFFFIILRGLIIVAVVYALVDQIKSFRFNAARRRQAKIDRETKPAITYKFPESQ